MNIETNNDDVLSATVADLKAKGWITDVVASLLTEASNKDRAVVAELIEAHMQSVAEIGRLRTVMFDVYATAHNEGDVIEAVERMRDVMDEPWSVDRSREALAAAGAKW